MNEPLIHNGQIIQDVPGVQTEAGQAGQPMPPQDHSAERARLGSQPWFDPNEIARQMAQVISLGQDEKLLPMEIVNRLLQLRIGDKKLVWTRFDVWQAFGLYYQEGPRQGAGGRSGDPGSAQ